MSSARRESPPQIPGFSYLRDLGHGGFADVYLYSQDTPRRQVAVKVLHSDMAGTQAAARLNKEADAMAGLSGHQNIVTVFSSGVAMDGRPYLVMEYYPGAALSQGLRKTQWSLANVLKIGIQLAGALESAHRYTSPGLVADSQGILHRDVKPANILMDRFSRPVLGDFGIAMTDVEAAKGGAEGMSIPWSPPESFDANPRPTRQSDIWSLAATIYALLTGRAPFEIPGGDNRQHVMIDRIRNTPYQPLGRVDAPASLDQVLSTAMAKSPQARYSSMKAFGMALREVESELHLPATQMDILEDADIDDRFGDDETAGTSLRPLTVIDPHVEHTIDPTLDPDPVQLAGLSQASDMARNAVHDRTPTAKAALPISSVPGQADKAPTAPAARPTTDPDGGGVLEPTQVRPMTLEQPAPPEPAPTEPVSPQPPRRRRWALVTLAVVIVAIAAVVLIVVLRGAPDVPPAPEDTPTTATPQNPIVNSTIPQAVTNMTGTHDPAGNAVFTWVNPAPQQGDQYRYTVDGSADVSAKITDQTTVSVPWPDQESYVCLDVQVVRHGVPSDTTKHCAVA
ncbi:MAG: serine/threonine protein kinase [Propionibacteriaceae bacterium]|nr:serine/threonine protein kinase [Propionibacteriaceae bacterium]